MKKYLIKTLKVINIILKEYLGIVAALFLVLNFLLWHTNIEYFYTNNYQLFNKAIIILLSAFLLNLKETNIKLLIKNNFFLLLIIASTIFNSLNLVYIITGEEINMGKRANELLMMALPHLLVVLGTYSSLSKRSFNIAVGLAALLLFGYSVLPILHKFKGIEEVFKMSISFTTRASSLLNNPNALGEFAYIGFFFTLFLIIVIKYLSVKLLLSPFLPIFLYAIILSGSKTSIYMVGLTILLVFIYFKSFDKKNKIYLVIFFITAIIAMVISYFKFYELVFEPLRIGSDLSGRDTIWYNTLKIVQKYNYKGIGYNNFTYVYNELYKKVTSPHNILLGVLSELGTLGLIFTISFFVQLLISNNNLIILNKENKDLKYLILLNAFYLTYFIGGFGEYSFLKIQSAGVLLIALAGFNVKVSSDIKKEEFEIKYLAIFILSLALSYLVSNYFFKDKSITIMISILVSIFFIIVVDYLTNLKKTIDNYYSISKLNKGK